MRDAAGAQDTQPEGTHSPDTAIENGVVSLFDLYVIETEKAKGVASEGGGGVDSAPLLGGGRRAAGLASADGGEALSDVMRGLFTKFDADGNGSIDKTEMRAVLVRWAMGGERWGGGSSRPPPAATAARRRPSTCARRPRRSTSS